MHTWVAGYICKDKYIRLVNVFVFSKESAASYVT